MRHGARLGRIGRPPCPKRLLRVPVVRWSSPGSRLPARVRERIGNQEERSEILVGWIQLAFIVGHGRRVHDRAEEVQRRRGVRACAVGAHRVLRRSRCCGSGLAHARSLPRWFVYASIVVDMTLLLVLIFSFHIQYRQPPSFYLKSPTLMYVLRPHRAARAQLRGALHRHGRASSPPSGGRSSCCT